MTKKTKALLAAVVVAALAVTAGIALLVVGAPGGAPDRTAGGPAESSDPGTGDSTPDARTATQIGEDFLDEWVDDDGRVVRRDQGDDTVSEGQAYGMLVAAAVGDEDRFAAIWDWTKEELVRPDGLLAWRWADGAVVDDMPASDADVDAARALVLAGTAFDRPDLDHRGRRSSARDVLDEMTGEHRRGRILLPGPWAAGPGPWSYNPSYASPAAFAQLGEASGDPRWTELEPGSRAVTTNVLTATALPSDWAQVQQDGTVVPLPSADGSSGTVQYSYDAGRLAAPLRRVVRARSTWRSPPGSRPCCSATPDLPMQLDLGGQDGRPGPEPARLRRPGRRARAAPASPTPPRPTSDVPTRSRSRRRPTTAPPGPRSPPSSSTTSSALGACSPLAVSR